MTRGARTRPEGFDPIGLAPENARRRYAKAGLLAHQQPLKAIKLKCLDCSAWEHREAKRCAIRSCPLWALNRWIFAGKANSE